MRLLLTALFVGILVTLAFAGPEVPIPGSSLPTPRVSSTADDVFATADLTTLLDPSGNSTQHFGPYPSTSPDSGTCQPHNPRTGTVDAGVTGSMYGYFIIPLPPATVQSSTDSSGVASVPSAPCTTADFIDTHFFPACYPVTCTVTTFFFHYSTGGRRA